MTTEETLVDAKVKYHLLVTGQAPRVVVDGNNNDRVEYQGASASLLLDYIRTMDPGYLLTVAPRTAPPLRFTF